MVKLMKNLRNKKGQGLVEYALIIALVSIAAVVALKTLTNGVNNQFSSVTSTLAG